jgi:signal transduction histidine kinase
MLEFHDDGIGVATESHSGVGMHSMRERAEELGGTLIITSNQPRGTVIQVALPLVTP